MSTLEKQRGKLAIGAGKWNLSQFLPLCFLSFFAVNSLWALDAERRITQYGHTAWRVQDGLIDLPNAITQTADGYIWIATRSGLVRFDGVTFSPWAPPNGQRLGSNTSLLGTADGSLWIGTTGGLNRWKDAELQTYTDQPGRTGISAILQDHAGTIWVTRYRVPEGEGPLCRVEGRSLHCYGKSDGIPVRYGLGIAEDNLGNLWMGSSVLCRWRPGSAATTYFGDKLGHLPAVDAVDVAAGPLGSVWATLDGVGPKLGVRHYAGGKWASYVVPGFDGATIRSNTLFIDRNKSLWIGTENKGLYHVHDGVADHYGSADGLSGDSVGFIYEDHEGNLWVSTDGGVDFFRDTRVVSYGVREGLSAANISSVSALHDGSVWIGNVGAVDILHQATNLALPVGHALLGHDIGPSLEDRTGAVWLGIDANSRLMLYKQGQFHEIRGQDGSTVGSNGEIVAMAEDVEHNVWVLTSGREPHLLRVTNQKVREAIPLDKDYSRAAYLVADREAGIWIVSKTGMLARLRDGRFQNASLGHPESSFIALDPFVDSDNSLWVPSAVGLFRWNNGRLNLIDASNGLPCVSIFSVVKDDSGSLWMAARCGFLKIEASELTKWNERPDSHLAIKMVDALDGAHPGVASILQPASSKAPDGRLWFINGRQVQMIDPDRSYDNSIPPPVDIQELIADHKSYRPQEHVYLPALVSELQFNYTALSFSVPGKVRFRYKLEGKDDHWEDPGNRRQAFYEDLGPGKYSFRVVACNNDGVWNDVGASLNFSIAPAWYQTYWFRIVCFGAGVLAVWTLYRFRVRQVAKAISARFDERLAERTRLARELHDTLLQTIQGSKMVADDALDQASDSERMRRAMERLSGWLGQAMQEVRTALNSLRISATQTNDLAESLKRATEDCLVKGSMEVTLSVTGAVQEMHPIVRDETYRIGYEAIRNADIHSRASRLDVELIYARDLTLRIHDNGIGVDRLIAEEGREGHFGLQGMRERAARIGASLTFVSSSNFGTEITLIVPGGIVFRKPSATAFKKIKTLLKGTGNQPN